MATTTTVQEDLAIIEQAFCTSLFAIAKEGKMLRSPLTSKTGRWTWEDLPTGHKLVGYLEVGGAFAGDFTYSTVYELDANGWPIRWFAEDTSDVTRFDFHEDVYLQEEGTVRMKWRVKGECFVKKCRVSARLVRRAHHLSGIPAELTVVDKANLLDSLSLTSEDNGVK